MSDTIPERPFLGITAGDPAGIGPEIVVKALADPEFHERARIAVISDPYPLEEAFGISKLEFELRPISSPKDGDYRAGVLNVIPTGVLSGPVFPGSVQSEAGRAAYSYIEKAIELAMDGRLDAICTAPINKMSLRAANIPYLDHTEILRVKTGAPEALSFFDVRSVRIFFLTRHIPFRDIPSEVTRDKISKMLVLCDRFLRDFGLERPAIAVAALNPHGGERGLFGNEEIESILPGIEDAREKGIEASGPIPADAVFQQALMGRYDAVLSLYHDQGHIAAKCIDFYGTVSITVGLPFLRTSVDHGTAFDIAGKGEANPAGMKEAIKATITYTLALKEHRGL